VRFSPDIVKFFDSAFRETVEMREFIMTNIEKQALKTGAKELAQVTANFFKAVAIGFFVAAIFIFLLFAENSDLLWSI